MFDVKNEVETIVDELIELRRDLHRHPELGLSEFRTSEIIEKELKSLDLEVRRYCNTGVVGILRGGKSGKTMLMRCDMDALPVTEDSGVPFSSETPGLMHACGHDSHVAIHLGTVKIMAKHREKLPGTIVFLFQLNEEDAGAEIMIQAGAISDPDPDVVTGFHIWTPLETGKIGVVSGPIMSSSWYFDLTVHGKGGHAGSPEKAINPIDAATQMVNAAKTICALEYDARKATVISFTQFHGGTGSDCVIIPNDCTLMGSIRCLHDQEESVMHRFKEMCEKIADAYRCTCEITFKCGNSMLNNDAVMTEHLRNAAAKVIGKENIVEHDMAFTIGDDFAEFSKRKPGVYYFVGTRNEEVGSVWEHHSPHFKIDEQSIQIATEIQLNLIGEYFGLQ